MLIAKLGRDIFGSSGFACTCWSWDSKIFYRFLKLFFEREIYINWLSSISLQKVYGAVEGFGEYIIVLCEAISKYFEGPCPIFEELELFRLKGVICEQYLFTVDIPKHNVTNQFKFLATSFELFWFVFQDRLNRKDIQDESAWAFSISTKFTTLLLLMHVHEDQLRQYFLCNLSQKDIEGTLAIDWMEVSLLWKQRN